VSGRTITIGDETFGRLVAFCHVAEAVSGLAFRWWVG